MHTQQEIELLAAFAMMSSAEQKMLLNGAKSIAQKYQQLRPSLKLVAGGRVATPCNDLFGAVGHLKNK